MTPLPPLLLGLTAPAGSGKDTVARYLEGRYAFACIGFADPVRDMLGALLEHVDVDGAWLVEHALKELPMPVLGRSYRELMQSLGTEWGRNTLQQGFWLLVAEHKLRQARERGDNLCFTDVRFPNEAAWLRAQGGQLVRVYRHAAPAVRAHESEQHIDALGAEHTLLNDSSLGALEHRIDALMERLHQQEPSA